MERLLKFIDGLSPDHCLKPLAGLAREKIQLFESPKGNAFYFDRAVKGLPDAVPSVVDMDRPKIRIGKEADVSAEESDRLKQSLFRLCPWRKGPFHLFGIDIDAEWQSWIKWERFEREIADLKGRRILDIGSSNGYYMFRVAARNPSMVLGLEPQHSFYYQYRAVQKFLHLDNVFCLPAGFQELPDMVNCFDTVFCMGILYHRKSPLDMLKRIHDMMRAGGQLIVENLVLQSEKGLCLFPETRYAKMRNVFFIPDIGCMASWLRRSGFSDVRCADVSKTTETEQRKTPWIQTETLVDFLDPADRDKTVEGYPAPVRAVFTAVA